jgi:hypothetical protein
MYHIHDLYLQGIQTHSWQDYPRASTHSDGGTGSHCRESIGHFSFQSHLYSALSETAADVTVLTVYLVQT